MRYTPEGKRRKALFVGFDGVRDDTLRELAPPAVRELADHGRWWSTTLPDVDVAPTVTAVGWSTLHTGVWPDVHKVSGNTDEYHLLHRYPSVLTRAYCADREIHTYAAASALIFGTHYGPGPILGPGVNELDFFDRREYPGGFIATDPMVFDKAVDAMEHKNPDLSFVYFGKADKIAHASGVGQEYEDVIGELDDYLGHLVAAVRRRPSFDREDWLVVLSTDHGHLDEGGHGGGSWQERQSFVVAGLLNHEADENWRPAAEPVDVAPTLLDHLGVEVDPAWGYAGSTLRTRG
jgi:predicted AlkP superfamily pyrophosphatase or phosphodiesterase